MRLARELQAVVAFSIQCIVLSSSVIEDYDTGDDGSIVDDGSIRCYSCMYLKMTINNEEIHQGSEHCLDPFVADDEMAVGGCKGSCGKFYTVHSDDSFTFLRGCMDTCKPMHKEDGSFFKCCQSDLCNGSTSTGSSNLMRRLVVTVVVSLTVAVVSTGRLRCP